LTDRETFRAWFDQAIAEAARTPHGIPLVGDASSAAPANPDALIALLADMITATCVTPSQGVAQPFAA
jgi:hypothetical protein